MSTRDQREIAQPDLSDAYETAGNPATQNPVEQKQGARHQQDVQSYGKTDVRIPERQGDFEDAVPSSLGRGIHGHEGKDRKEWRPVEEVGRHRELDAEQMAAPGEGKVYDAVASKTDLGASGEQVDFATDLDRKKAEQAPLRKEISEQRSANVDVGGVLGQRGGPANPVD